MNGLLHPADLEAWHAWSRRGVTKRMRSAIRPTAPVQPPSTYRNAESPPQVAVAISSASPSARAALLAPLRWLGDTSVIVVSDVDLRALLPGWSVGGDWQSVMGGVKAVMGDGNFLHLGREVWAVSVQMNVPYFVSQHGAVTSFAPPLPPDAHLITWSDADGGFWTAGRNDVTVHLAGSQLLWDAAAKASSVSPPPGPLTFLGQGHSAEVGRTRMSEAALRFCWRHGATYRPHPSERDKVSRLTIEAFRRLRIAVDDSVPLNEMSGPVVSVFSTGVLEAAAQGREAWVDIPRPPGWLSEFWARYGMRRFGGEPTPPLEQPAIEPARRIADLLREVAS